MRKPLTASYLLANGFEEVGCWDASERRLSPPLRLPGERGVYAFAAGDEVLYVGLASRSLKQRLSFYARPGVSQRTNVRLNGLIRNAIGEGRGGSVCLYRLAVWISGLPLVDHAAARSGCSKYTWSGVRPPSAEWGLTAL